MVTLYAVVGHGDARKSSTIRALSGVGNADYGRNAKDRWEMQLADYPMPQLACVVAGGLQEDYRFTPQGFIDRMHSLAPAVMTAIIALRLVGPNEECPDGEEYLRRFATRRWAVNYAIIGGTELFHELPNGRLLERGLPANELAAQLRTAWQIR